MLEKGATKGKALSSHREDILPFLSSLQLADSFFPGGLYTLSHGLETFVQEALVKPETLADLLCDYLHYSLGPADGIALACAHQAHEEGLLTLATQADYRLSAVKLPREARESSVRVGRQLLLINNQVFQDPILREYQQLVERGEALANHAIVLGLTLAALSVSREHAVAGELYTFTAHAIAAAVRMVVIDHRVAQSILHQLKPVIAEVARETCARGLADIGGCAPLIDSMTMRHEQAEIRLFMS